MQYVLYILLVAVIFGLVALADFLLKKLFPVRLSGCPGTVPSLAPL